MVAKTAKSVTNSKLSERCCVANIEVIMIFLRNIEPSFACKNSTKIKILCFFIIFLSRCALPSGAFSNSLTPIHENASNLRRKYGKCIKCLSYTCRITQQQIDSKDGSSTSMIVKLESSNVMKILLMH